MELYAPESCLVSCVDHDMSTKSDYITSINISKRGYNIAKLGHLHTRSISKAQMAESSTRGKGVSKKLMYETKWLTEFALIDTLRQKDTNDTYCRKTDRISLSDDSLSMEVNVDRRSYTSVLQYLQSGQKQWKVDSSIFVYNFSSKYEIAAVSGLMRTAATEVSSNSLVLAHGNSTASERGKRRLASLKSNYENVFVQQGS